jgi:hypothetical protein
MRLYQILKICTAEETINRVKKQNPVHLTEKLKNIIIRGEKRIKKNGGGVNSSMTYLIHCKNFCKCHNVSPLSITIKR